MNNNKNNRRIFLAEATATGLLSTQGIDIPRRGNYRNEEDYMKADGIYWKQHAKVVENVLKRKVT